jgi:ketosteroid isomerase-like protein
MTDADAYARAAEWIAAWNSHDLDRILSHYEDDFSMSSPYIARVMREPTGTLHGKDAVRRYWSKGLALAPQLHFVLLDVFLGVDGIAVYYSSTVADATVVEFLTIGVSGRYSRGHAHNVVTRVPAS